VSDFISVPPNGQSSSTQGSAVGGVATSGASGSSGGSSSGGSSSFNGSTSAPTAGATSSGSASSPPTSSRQVEETDLYRFDAATNRLYYLNSYRGLLVFDVSNIDAPQLLGRASIFGNPVDMVVNSGIVAVIIGDWYGTALDGTPFHGSIVRGYDTTDPTHIAPVGEAQVPGWVQDSRVVADPNSTSGVLYMVSTDYGWSYGWNINGTYSSSSNASGVIVTSVSFGPTGIKEIDRKSYTQAPPSSSNCYSGYYGSGIFNVTNVSIMLAREHLPAPTTGCNTNYATQTDLTYLDITDPAGKIVERGTIAVNGVAEGWGADNGRWNLDFADKIHAHLIGEAINSSYWGNQNGYLLETADFSNPDAPTLASELAIPSQPYSMTARFDSNRMYLSPASTYYYTGTSSEPLTPVQIYDTSNPAAPALAGQTQIPGTVWLFMPSGNQLFALGQQNVSSTVGNGGYIDSSLVSLSYLNVTSAASPTVIGTASFGNGWAWTPAASTFKAFTEDDTRGLVVLPFGSWSNKDYTYINGVQLIQFTPPTAATAGANATPGSIAISGTAGTKGYVERGIFVKNRLISLSDLTLAVIDYSTPTNPVTVTEVTLARNVVDATPQATTIAELSTDWWGNDTSTSDLRLRPISDPEEDHLTNVPDVTIAGTDAQVFHNKNNSLAYVVTSVQLPLGCAPKGTCTEWTQQVQVVDESGTSPVLRGAVTLPAPPSLGYDYWSDYNWYGYWDYDWYNGSNIVQVGENVLAFRRWFWSGNYYYGGNFDDTTSALFVVDATNPDSPTIASTTITQDKTTWWGDMRAVGDTLYTTHYEWYTGPVEAVNAGGVTYTPNYVRYYLDRIDLTDPAHPKVGSKINVPGILVGSMDSDPTVLFTMDYFWGSDGSGHDRLSAVRVQGDKAYLLSTVPLDGWVGRVITQNNVAYMSVESSGYSQDAGYWSNVQLHQIDMNDPSNPVDTASAAQGGWGWLMDVQGDRAFISSGWGNNGIDIYKLAPATPPKFDQFVRTLGWSPSSLKRQDNTVYVATGYWGVQAITLQ